MGEVTDNRDKFWKEQSMPAAREIIEKVQALCDNLEKAGACTPEMHCWIRNMQLELSKMPEL